MICTNYNLIFPQSTRWRLWWLFEQEVSAAADLQPYLSPKPHEDLEPYFHRSDDLSQYDADAFVHSYHKDVVCYEDLCMRQSILFRARRRQAIANGEDRSIVDEFYEKERQQVIESFAWTEWPSPYESYEEWEAYIYTYVQHLLDEQFETGFGKVTEQLQAPSAAALNNWAYGFLKSGVPSDALSVLFSALELDFNCRCVWHTLSEVYEALDQPDKVQWALNEFNKLRS